MTLWRFEAWKMFKSNRGLVIAALFLAAELALLLLTDAPVNADAARNREGYLRRLEAVDGPWTPEKAEYLEREARIGEVRGDEGFDALYRQYLYVNEGREDRYFLDANGWAGLLAERGPDLPLAAAVVLLCVPIYCGEAVSGMEALALTTKSGKRLFLRHKLLLALFTAAALSLSSDLVRIVFYAVKYGLPHGDYPVQSVELFGSAAKNLSLRGAEALAVALRLLGALELGALTLCVSALVNRFALTAFVSTALVVLPWVGLRGQAQYALPLPSSLMAPVGFLRGSEFERDALTGESVAVFREVSRGELALIALGAAILCGVCVLAIRGRYRTALPDRRGTGGKCAALCLALLLCLTLGGCAGEREDLDPEALFEEDPPRSYSYNGLTVSVVDGELTVTDSSGNSQPLVRDALKGVNGVAYDTGFRARGKYVYLWQMDSEGYGEKLSTDAGKTYITTLVRVDLETFTWEAVYENVAQHTVLGIDLPAGSKKFSIP